MGRIRIKESQLHNVINESIKALLNEYQWNGRTQQQDQASINAANKPMSWKAHLLQARKRDANSPTMRGQYHRKQSEKQQRDKFNREEDYFGTHTKFNAMARTGYPMKGDNLMNPDAFAISHVHQNFDKGNRITGDKEANFVDSKHTNTDNRMSQNSQNGWYDDISMSPDMSKHIRSTQRELDDFQSGRYSDRIQNKRQQLYNSINESVKRILKEYYFDIQ